MLTLHQKLHACQNKKAAWEIVEEYFTCFSMQTVNKDLWTMLFASITKNEEVPMQKGVERENLIFFYQFTLLMIEAVQLLQSKKKAQHQPAATH